MNPLRSGKGGQAQWRFGRRHRRRGTGANQARSSDARITRTSGTGGELVKNGQARHRHLIARHQARMSRTRQMYRADLHARSCRQHPGRGSGDTTQFTWHRCPEKSSGFLPYSSQCVRLLPPLRASESLFCEHISHSHTVGQTTITTPPHPGRPAPRVVERGRDRPPIGSPGRPGRQLPRPPAPSDYSSPSPAPRRTHPDQHR